MARGMGNNAVDTTLLARPAAARADAANGVAIALAGPAVGVGADKDDSRYKCDKVTTTTDAFRVCCCGSVVTAAPTTDDSQ